MNNRREIQKRDSKLSVEQIVATALALINESDAQSFSIRNLSRELQVTPMALYRHIGGRSELLGLVLDLILRDVDKAAETDPRLMSFSELALSYGAVAMRHPQVFLAYLGDANAQSTEAERLSRQMVAALVRLGHNPSEAEILRNIVVDHTHGYVVASSSRCHTQANHTALTDGFHQASSVLMSKLLRDQ